VNAGRWAEAIAAQRAGHALSREFYCDEELFECGDVDGRTSPVAEQERRAAQGPYEFVGVLVGDREDA